VTPPTNDHSAASITGRAFDVRRKGFDPDEVRAYLGQLAEVVQRLTAERDEARAQVRDLRAEAEARPAIDEDQLTAALGEETARVLTSARRAAVEMKERAEESVAQMLREAAEAAGATRRDAEAAAARKVEEAERVRAEVDEERARVEAELAEETTRVRAELEAEATAAREAIETDRTAAAEAAREAAEAADAAAAAVRAEADEVLATRTAEAEEAAAAIRAAAEAAAVEIRQAADDDAAGSRATGESEREALQEEGKAMVAEAQRVRERMLADLSRRRKAARVQLEQLQAARDRLLESYDAVQRTLDEATSGLRRALPDARAAADSARIRVEAEPDTTVDELEAQIAAARDAGLPLVAADGDATGAAAAGDAADAGPALEVVADVDAPSTDGSGVPGVPGDSGDDVDDRVVAGPDPASVVESEPVTEEVPVVADDASLDEPPADGAEVEELFARLKASRGEAADDAAEAASDAAGDAAGDAAVEADAPDDPVDLTAAEDASDEPPVASDAGEGVDDEAGGSGPEGDLLGLIGRRDGALEPIESRVARRLKRALADEQGRVLDGVRRQAGSSGLDDLLPLDAQVAAFAEAVGADLHAAAEEGAAFEGAALPTSVSVDVLADELGRSLAGVVRPRVERCFDDGEDADDLSDRLRTTYREWKTDALVEATRHVVLAAFGVGQQAVRPAGTPVRWVPDPGHPPCPDCEDDALAGALPSGEAFPTGHAHPPAHPGCRCLVVGEPVAALA